MNKNNPYSDEVLKNSKNPGDVANYNLIQGYKEDYKRAAAAGDTKGMEEAHKNAEAVRSAYGYTGGASGNAYASIAPVKEQNNSFFGNVYEDINKMQKEGFNAYKGLVDAQKKGNIDSVNRGKRIINQNYNNAYDELMSQQDKTLGKLPEDMAKLGLYGSGTGETAYAKIKSGYAGELKKLLADKNNALADIDGKIADLENQSAIQIAQYYADMMQKSPEMYLSVLHNQYGEKIDERNFNYQVDRDKVADNKDERDFNYMVGIDERNFNYQVDRDKVADNKDERDFNYMVGIDERNFNYQVDRDKVEDNRNDKIYADSRGDVEYEKKLNAANIAAAYGNYQPLADLGIITPEMQKFNTDKYIIENTPSVTSSKSSKSGTGNSSKKKTETKSDKPPMTEKEVKDWADYLNNSIGEKYDGYTALNQINKNEYERGNVDADYIIIRILNSDDLNQEQKDYLLYDKFNISESEVNNVLRDNHYR